MEPIARAAFYTTWWTPPPLPEVEGKVVPLPPIHENLRGAGYYRDHEKEV